jgi:hypothetical protein
MPFWRREKLHERLAREGGLIEARAPHDTRPLWGGAGIHGVHRQREWDAVAAVDAPAARGDEVELVVLADGSLLLDDEQEAAELEPLADAIEGALAPPYRLSAVRRGGTTWAVGAKKIELAELPEQIQGDELVLAVADGERTLTVDGASSRARIPELEALGGVHRSFVVRAERLDDTLWEVNVSPL